jgi:MoxR-like ATPase
MEDSLATIEQYRSFLEDCNSIFSPIAWRAINNMLVYSFGDGWREDVNKTLKSGEHTRIKIKEQGFTEGDFRALSKIFLAATIADQTREKLNKELLEKWRKFKGEFTPSDYRNLRESCEWIKNRLNDSAHFTPKSYSDPRQVEQTINYMIKLLNLLSERQTAKELENKLEAFQNDQKAYSSDGAPNKTITDDSEFLSIDSFLNPDSKNYAQYYIDLTTAAKALNKSESTERQERKNHTERIMGIVEQMIAFDGQGDLLAWKECPSSADIIDQASELLSVLCQVQLGTTPSARVCTVNTLADANEVYILMCAVSALIEVAPAEETHKSLRIICRDPSLCIRNQPLMILPGELKCIESLLKEEGLILVMPNLWFLSKGATGMTAGRKSVLVQSYPFHNPGKWRVLHSPELLISAPGSSDYYWLGGPHPELAIATPKQVIMHSGGQKVEKRGKCISVSTESLGFEGINSTSVYSFKYFGSGIHRLVISSILGSYVAKSLSAYGRLQNEPPILNIREFRAASVRWIDDEIDHVEEEFERYRIDIADDIWDAYVAECLLKTATIFMEYPHILEYRYLADENFGAFASWSSDPIQMLYPYADATLMSLPDFLLGVCLVYSILSGETLILEDEDDFPSVALTKEVVEVTAEWLEGETARWLERIVGPTKKPTDAVGVRIPADEQDTDNDEDSTSAPINERVDFAAISNQIKKDLIGQDNIVDSVLKKTRNGMLGKIRKPDKPYASFIFAGTTGTGKTELAKLLAEYLGFALQRIDMSEFKEDHSIARLTGAPTGYVGMGDGQLMKIEDDAVILFDEIEKAHLGIMDVFLQILDRGGITSGTGEYKDLSKCIIIATTNIGAAEYYKQNKAVGFGAGKNEPTNKEFDDLIKSQIRKQIRAEIYNRFDAIEVFHPLSEDAAGRIVDNLVEGIRKAWKSSKVELIVSDLVLEIVKKVGYSKEFGARELKRTVERIIDDSIWDYYNPDYSDPVRKLQTIKVESSLTASDIENEQEFSILEKSVFFVTEPAALRVGSTLEVQ